MNRTLREIFAEEMMATEINAEFCKSIIQFDKSFVNKNEVNIEFFGSPLLGVHPMRFTNTERDDWFEIILQIDESTLRKEFHTSKAIVTTRKVAPDTFNFSCIALIDLLLNVDHIDRKLIEATCVSVLSILFYKILGSILSRFFPNPANKGVAIAAYNQMSKKFEIKAHGSWGKFITAKCAEFLSPGSTFRKRAENMTDINYVSNINNFHTGIKSVVKSMNEVLYTVLRDKNRYLSSSAIGVDMEGKDFIKDVSRKYPDYRNYLHSIISDRSSFIKKELIEVIAQAVPSLSADFLMDTLRHMVDNYGNKRAVVVSACIDETLFFTFDYIERNKTENFNTNNLAELLIKLKNVYTSSRNTDEKLIKLREDIEGIVSNAIRSRNPSVISSVRTGVMLYIVLRAFTRNYYSS